MNLYGNIEETSSCLPLLQINYLKLITTSVVKSMPYEFLPGIVCTKLYHKICKESYNKKKENRRFQKGEE